jgi:hypothetical protein
LRGPYQFNNGRSYEAPDPEKGEVDPHEKHPVQTDKSRYSQLWQFNPLPVVNTTDPKALERQQKRFEYTREHTKNFPGGPQDFYSFEQWWGR